MTGALKAAPALATLALGVALMGGAGACGRSIYPQATDTPTATATIVPSPTTGNFLYTSNFLDGKVAEFNRNLTTGALTLAGSIGAGSASGPVGIATGPSAHYIYVANSANNNVRQFKVGLSNGLLTALGTIAAGNSPQWIAVDPTASFAFVTNLNAGTITPYTIDSSNGKLAANGGSIASSLLKNPSGALARTTYLYVGDQAKGTVVSFPYNSSGTISTGTATLLGSGSPLATPGQMVIDPSGKFVYISDLKAGLLYYLTIGSGVLTWHTTYNPSGAAEGGLVTVATSSGFNFLYIANQQVSPPSISSYQINSDGTLTPTFPATTTDPSLNLPTGLAVDPTGAFLYVANQGSGTVTQFTINPSTGALSSPTVVSTESSGSGPVYIAIAH
jgi:6-phosphogluconolactonase